MSDTDDDVVPNILHKLPHEKIVHHQLSNVNKTSYSSYNNIMTSNFNMPYRFRGFDQRSMCSRRETSPMSMRSFPVSRMQYQQYPASSGGSMYKAPESVRSFDSRTSENAENVASFLKNSKLNKYDNQLLWNACIQFIKTRRAKRRKLKSFIKHIRRDSGGESGAEGSNSSISSDDCRSTRSAFYTRNIPNIQARQPRMDLKKFATQMRKNDIYRDNAANFKHTSGAVNHSFMPNQIQNEYDNRFDLPGPHQGQRNELRNAPVDYFAKNKQLPLQRFNMSSVNPNYEVSYTVKPKTQKESANNNRHESDCESDEIFTQSTSTVNLAHSNTLKQRRILEVEDASYPESKRKKLSISPVKKNKSTSSKNLKNITTKTKDFNFKKPQLPIRRFGTLRDNESEVLIAKSTQPLVGNVEPLSHRSKEMPQVAITAEAKLDTNKQRKQQPKEHIDDTINNNTVADSAHNSTDVSMKPSFIKRKLFTQTLDILENNNISADNSGVNSPLTKSLRACREKNKVRKLTSQSCLSRDISDNNYMDLIHKIVPPGQCKNQTLNNTNVANKKENTTTRLEKDDKWDVSVALSTCGDADNMSEVYTDEEIFDIPQKNTGKTKLNKNTDTRPKSANDSQIKQNATPSMCNVLLQKMSGTSGVKENNTEKLKNGKQSSNKLSVKSCVKSFWDTDFETETDDPGTPTSQRTVRRNQIPRDSQFLKSDAKNAGKNKPSGSILSTQNLQIPEVNRSTSASKPKNTQSLKGTMLDNLQENKENNKDSQIRSSRSRLKKKEANIQTGLKNLTNNKSNTNKLPSDSESKNQNIKMKNKNNNKKQGTPKHKTSSDTNKKSEKLSQSIFNISKESLRPRQRSVCSSNNSSLTLNCTKPEVESDKLNTSRQSLRIKQKRETKLSHKKR